MVETLILENLTIDGGKFGVAGGEILMYDERCDCPEFTERGVASAQLCGC